MQSDALQDCQQFLEFSDVNDLDEDGDTMLIFNASSGYDAAVELLLTKEDIDVNKTGQLGYSPLFVACSNGHEGNHCCTIPPSGPCLIRYWRLHLIIPL